MANREIDEAEYAALAGVHASVAGMLKHPEARKLILKAAKTANPNAVIPEIDAAAPIDAAVSGVQTELAAIRKEMADERAERTQAEQIARFQGKWADQEAALRREGWRAGGIVEVRKFAEDNGIADLTIAAAAYANLHPEPAPVTTSNGAWDMFGTAPNDKEDTFVEDMMKAGGNNERRLDQEIAAIVRDARSQR